MTKLELLKKRRQRRKYSVRKNIFGTASKPRVSVFKSNKSIYVQAIDDENGVTLASASSVKEEKTVNAEISKTVGKTFAEALKAKKIDTIVFDRNGFIYTGKIKALADSIRENGIKF